jgi:hypothetical protein
LDEMLDVVEEINTMTGMVLTGSDGSGDDPEMAELEHAIKKALSDNEG